MKRTGIKRITLTRLVQVFLGSIFIILATIAFSYRSFFQVTVENEALSIADIIKAGLTSHMKAEIMDKRGFFLDEIASVHDIDSITIFRTQEVIKEYGKSTYRTKKTNATIEKMLATKEAQFLWSDTDAKVQAVIPYVASNEGKINCLECHNVADGEILGGVDIEMNISTYQSLALQYGYMLALLLMFFALMIIFNMFYVIERYVKKPLSLIIDDGHEAYYSGKDIQSDKYESYEFNEVAKNINDFNKDVIKSKEELVALNVEIDLTLKETLMAMGQMEEIRSDETRFHTKRVAILSVMIAKAYGLNAEEVKRIELASPLHDIGKIAIEDSILKKPGRLTEAEFIKMKTHAELGYKTLKNSKRAVLRSAAEIAYEHHEKFDGTGYPRGLKGEEISLFARIVAIVDVLDALLSRRVYKEKWSREQVIEYFEEESAKHFDPKIVVIVLENIDEYIEVIEQYSETK